MCRKYESLSWVPCTLRDKWGDERKGVKMKEERKARTPQTCLFYFCTAIWGSWSIQDFIGLGLER